MKKIIFKDPPKRKTKLRRNTSPKSANWIRTHCGRTVYASVVAHVLTPCGHTENLKPYGPKIFAVYKIADAIKNMDEIVRLSKMLIKLRRYTCPDHWKKST